MAVCAATLMIGTVLQSSLIPLLPRLAHQSHLGTTLLAIVAGAYSAGILLAALPTGVLVARFGPQRVLTSAVAMLAGSTYLIALDSGPVALIISRLLQGVAGCMVWGSAFPWVADIAPAHRQGRATGILLSAGVAGGLVGPSVPLVVDAIGHRATFTALGVVATVICLACLRLPGAEPSSAVAGATSGREVRALVALGGWLVVVVGVVVGTCQVMGALRIDAAGGSTTTIAALLTAATACQTVLNPLVGLATDRLGHAPPIGFGLVAVTVTLLAFTLPRTAGVQVVIVLLTLCSTTLVWCPAVALMSSAAREIGLHQGTVFAVVNLAWASGTLLGAAGSGIVSSDGHQGFATVALAVVAATTAIAARSTLRASHPR